MGDFLVIAAIVIFVIAMLGLIVCAVGLHALGHEVWTAVTGSDGLSEATIRAPDVIVLDLGLPDMDGMDVCEREDQAELDVGALHLDLVHCEATLDGRFLDLTPRSSNSWLPRAARREGLHQADDPGRRVGFGVRGADAVPQGVRVPDQAQARRRGRPYPRQRPVGRLPADAARPLILADGDRGRLGYVFI